MWRLTINPLLRVEILNLGANGLDDRDITVAEQARQLGPIKTAADFPKFGSRANQTANSAA